MPLFGKIMVNPLADRVFRTRNKLDLAVSLSALTALIVNLNYRHGEQAVIASKEAAGDVNDFRQKPSLGKLGEIGLDTVYAGLNAIVIPVETVILARAWQKAGKTMTSTNAGVFKSLPPIKFVKTREALIATAVTFIGMNIYGLTQQHSPNGTPDWLKKAVGLKKTT